jgi:site-specific DNA recombinase
MAASRNGKPTSTAIATALLYTRVSSDEQASEGLSLDAQLAVDRRYVAERGWIIGAEYQDVLSGKRDDRPDYQRMLGEARRLRSEGRPVVVVVPWLHRLGRRVFERVRSREEMKALGVPLHSVHEGGEVSDLVSNILASVAEEEVRQLGGADRGGE